MFSTRGSSCIKPQKTAKNPQRMSKMKPFINNYNWKEISFPSHVKHWKKFESYNKSIALNVLILENNKEKIKRIFQSIILTVKTN